MMRKLILPAAAVLFLAGCGGASDHKTVAKEKMTDDAQTQVMETAPNGGEQQDEDTIAADPQGATTNGHIQSASNENAQLVGSLPPSSDANGKGTGATGRVESTEEAVNIQPMDSRESTARTAPASASSDAMIGSSGADNAQNTSHSGAFADNGGAVANEPNNPRPMEQSVMESQDNSSGASESMQGKPMEDEGHASNEEQESTASSFNEATASSTVDEASDDDTENE